MFADTSALVEILINGPRATLMSERLGAAATRMTSPLVRLETCMVLSTRIDIAPTLATRQFDQLLELSQLKVVVVTDAIATLAVAAFERYGKGRDSRAKLNFGDCFSYACAKSLQVPLLFIGSDFIHTDVEFAQPMA